MDDLTPLQILVFFCVAGISIVVIANAIMDVYIRPSSARFFYPRSAGQSIWRKQNLGD